jgi:hypothetical protein
LQRRAIDWKFVADRVSVGVLLVWFALFSLPVLRSAFVDAHWAGIDAALYHRAALAWLNGSDPWSASIDWTGPTYHFSALPTAVLIFAATAWLPEAVVAAMWIGANVVAAVYLVRRIGLGWHYLLFPPVAYSVLTGNPSLVVAALLLGGSPILDAVGGALKVYALVPILLLRRWRSAVSFGVLVAMTVPFLPLWVDYASRVGVISTRLHDEALGGYSAFALGWPVMVLTAVGLIAMYRRDREGAAWLTVPAAWPGSEVHWLTLAMPLLRRYGWLAWILAVPVRGAAVLALLALVVVLYPAPWRRLATKIRMSISADGRR